MTNTCDTNLLLVDYLKEILSTLASLTPGSPKLMHVQADHGMVDFYSNQGFVASSLAGLLTRTLAAGNASGNEVHTGAVSMLVQLYDRS